MIGPQSKKSAPARELSPLEDMVMSNDTAEAQKLLEAGADFNQKDSKGLGSLLHMAAWFGHVEMVSLLIDKGMKVDRRGLNNMTPLMAAAMHGRVETICLLLSLGAEINATSSDNSWTPLIYTVMGNKPEALQLLIDKGADMAACDRRNDTALQLAVKRHQPKLAQMLREQQSRAASSASQQRISAERGTVVIRRRPLQP